MHFFKQNYYQCVRNAVFVVHAKSVPFWVKGREMRELLRGAILS